MTLVSSKEFVSNQKQYINHPEENDDDYISKEELLAGIYEDIDKFYANR